MSSNSSRQSSTTIVSPTISRLGESTSHFGDSLAFSGFFVEQRFAALRAIEPSSILFDDRQARDDPNSVYVRHRLTLTYCDAATEARFVRHIYDRSMCFGSVIISVGVFAISCLCIYTITSLVPRIVSIISLFWALVSIVITLHPRAVAWREVCSHIMVALSALLFALAGYEFSPNVTGSAPLAQFAVCVLLLPCRFSRMILIGPIAFVASHAYASYAAGHWDDRSLVHTVIWWPLLISVTGFHNLVEQRKRTAFEQIDVSSRDLAAINNHIGDMQRMVAGFFPETAVKDLLKSSSNDSPPSKTYKNTVVVVTDAVGFTSWATRTSPATVIEHLGRLLVALDRAAPAHGVEKLCTVGDSFVGVVFPKQEDESNDRMSTRVVCAIQFGLEATCVPDMIQVPLRNRVGVHIGDVLGGFVGISPLAFDLFGFTLLFAKHMESTGEPDKVHVSDEAMNCALRVGRPVDSVETEEGILLTGWEESTCIEQPHGQPEHQGFNRDTASAISTALLRFHSQHLQHNENKDPVDDVSNNEPRRSSTAVEHHQHDSKLNFWRLCFDNPSLERSFVAYLRLSKACHDNQFICAMSLLYLFCIHFSVGFVDEPLDRIACIVYILAGGVAMILIALIPDDFSKLSVTAWLLLLFPAVLSMFISDGGIDQSTNSIDPAMK
eukprot:PhM_4_TR16758/c1_g1_i3/m.26543